MSAKAAMLGVELRQGDFEFGIKGWVWGAPIPKSVTFFLDGSALVADQYGNRVRGVLMPDGRQLTFADKPPEASKDDTAGAPPRPRPQFATHKQVIDALLAERIDWLAYEVRWRGRDNRNNVRSNLSLTDAVKQQEKLLADGHATVAVERTIACAGWPQLPYDELKKLQSQQALPPTPLAELRKIRDPELRRDAMRIRREVDEAREKELQVAFEEDG